MTILKTLCYSYLLASAVYAPTALAQGETSPPSPSDVLAGVPLFPPSHLPKPGVNWQAEWEQLVAQAREAGRAQWEAERAEIDELRDRGGGEEQRRTEGVKVVRETFYVPIQSQGKGQFPLAPAAEDKTGAPAVGSSAVPPPPADIVKTVGKLRTLSPVFKYAIHHPLRFLYRYALVPLFHSVTLLLALVYFSLLYLLFTALSPLQLVVSVLLAPLISLYNLNVTLLPLWGTLGGALLAGSGLGAIAGLVAGRTTREIIDEAVWRTKKSLIWVGLLSKEPKLGVPSPTGKSSYSVFGPGARLETLGDVFGSSRARAQEAEKKRRKGQGKERALASALEGENSDETPPGHFNPINVSSRRSVAVLAPDSNPFPDRISTSLAQRRHQEKASPPPPGYGDDGEHADPPSEEVYPAERNPAGTRSGGDGRISGKAKVATSGSGGATGWRERDVDF
ncbi:hypothetical protein JCM11251_001184 [Rhodosporidiobolus azoricus]